VIAYKSLRAVSRRRKACAEHAERAKLAGALKGPRIVKAVADAHERRSAGRCVQVAGDKEVDYGLVRDPEPARLQDAG
jgi:hypothetical protein